MRWVEQVRHPTLSCQPAGGRRRRECCCSVPASAIQACMLAPGRTCGSSKGSILCEMLLVIASTWSCSEVRMRSRVHGSRVHGSRGMASPPSIAREVGGRHGPGHALARSRFAVSATGWRNAFSPWLKRPGRGISRRGGGEAGEDDAVRQLGPVESTEA